MNAKTLVCCLVWGLSVTTANAIESWKGSKFIYSTSSSGNPYAIKVELNENGTAKVVSNNGSALGKFEFKDGKININFSSPQRIKKINYPVKAIPGTHRTEQVLMEKELDKLVIDGNERGAFVNETWTNCFMYTVGGMSAKECETKSNDINNPVLVRTSLNPVSTSFSARDNIVVPIISYDSAFVTIDSNGNASPVDSDVKQNHLIKKISTVNSQVEVEMKDGSKILFGETRRIEGLSRVVGVQTWENGEERLVTGLFVVDQKVDASKLDPSGSYKTVLLAHSGNHGVVYEFNPDGFGGFEFMLLDKVTKFVWSWNFDDYRLNAYRYRKLGLPISDINEIQSCMNSDDCFAFQKRTYIIIGKDGNKYTMLRRMSHQPGKKNEGFDEDTQQSVWVFYKK